ncbi:MAG: hypothetical protein JKY37_14505, partial [Nannocystaceae bacterium]|nr:hypothetical protein [Nannocystaceae bacterium]
ASSEWFSADGPTMYRKHNARNHARALYVREHTASDTVIGVHWAGVPVYFSERPAVDLLGKSDRHIAKLRVRRFHPGHSKWDWDYVVNVRKPDAILIATRGLARRADFQRHYAEVVRDGKVRFFMRRESLPKLHDPRATIREVDSL